MRANNYTAIPLQCFGKGILSTEFILRNGFFHQCQKAHITNLARRIESLRDAQLEMGKVINKVLGE